MPLHRHALSDEQWEKLEPLTPRPTHRPLSDGALLRNGRSAAGPAPGIARVGESGPWGRGRRRPPGGGIRNRTGVSDEKPPPACVDAAWLAHKFFARAAAAARRRRAPAPCET